MKGLPLHPRPLHPWPIGPARSRAGRAGAREGFALIVVLWVVLACGLILLGVRRQVQVNLAGAQTELETTRARWLARAGVERAIAVLRDDTDGCDGATDDWYDSSSIFENIELMGGTVSVLAPPQGHETQARFGLIDHAGMVDLNTADIDALKALGLQQSQAASIIDWRDEDTQAQGGGAEAAFYSQLGRPYNIRNGPMKTVSELKLIQGITRAVYEGDAADRGRADDGRPRQDLGGVCTVYAYELNLDAYGQPRLNINSADKQTLMDRLGVSDALAQAIAGTSSQPAPSSPAEPGEAGEAPAPSGPERSEPGAKGGSQRYGSLMDLLNVKASAQSGQSSQDESQSRTSEITINWIAQHMDELTVSDERRLPSRLNVNTASMEALMTLPQMTELGAYRIIQRRQGPRGPFDNMAQLLDEEIVSEEQFKACGEKMTLRSQVFEIRSLGVTRLGVRHMIVAVVDRGQENVNILYWRQQ